jgi:hypothetical protein
MNQLLCLAQPKRRLLDEGGTIFYTSFKEKNRRPLLKQTKHQTRQLSQFLVNEFLIRTIYNILAPTKQEENVTIFVPLVTSKVLGSNIILYFMSYIRFCSLKLV